MAIDTARGRPSGIATISIQTAMITIFEILRTVSFESKLIYPSKRMRIKANKVCVVIMMRVMIMAYFAIVSARPSNFSSRYVCCSLITRSCGVRLRASLVLLPTAQTTALPEPVIIIDPDKRNGSGCVL